MNKIPVIPGYIKALPDDALLNSKEVAEIYGVSTCSVNNKAYIEQGLLPAPFVKNKEMAARIKFGFSAKKNYWRVIDVKRHAAQKAKRMQNES